MSYQTDSTKELFDNIAKFVEDSRFLLKEGATAELAGMDKHVQKLCEAVLQVPASERDKYAELLQTLMDELVALEGELVTKRDALVHEISYLSSHKKANVAYKTVDASDRNSTKSDG